MIDIYLDGFERQSKIKHVLLEAAPGVVVATRPRELAKPGKAAEAGCATAGMQRHASLSGLARPGRLREELLLLK